MENNRKNHIVFLPVPGNLRARLESLSGCDHAEGSPGHEHFSIDPDIPIPAEISGEKPNLEELSPEMILAGMLRVITAGEEKPAWLQYYRDFVLALRPDILAEFTEAAILKARNGDFDLALEILDTLRRLFPASPAVRLNRALVLEERAALFEKQGRKDGTAAVQAASAAYEEVLALDPPLPEAYFNAGYFHFQQNNFRLSRKYFSRFLAIADADDPVNTEQAQSMLKAIEESGLDDDSFLEAGELIRQGDAEGALQQARDFLERYPLVWNGWFVLGWILRRLGRYADGVSALQKALELISGTGGAADDASDDKDAGTPGLSGDGTGAIRNELAICLMETGDLAGARRELEAALWEDPENVKIISNLGVLAAKRGCHDEAAGFFRTVLEIDPDDQVAKNFLRPA